MNKPLLAALLALSLAGCAGSPVRRATAEEGFHVFLRRWEAAQNRFINGDPAPWKLNASRGGDVTVFGAFGGHEKGWEQVGPRYDRAAAQYRDAGVRKTVEYLNTGVSGDLAFTVAIERQSAARVGDQAAAADPALRVTQIFRREDGRWKLLHRHADPLVEKRPPGAAPGSNR